MPANKAYSRVRPAAILSAVAVAAACLCGPAAAGDPRDALRERLTRASDALVIDGFALDAPLLQRVYRTRNFDPMWPRTHGQADRAVAVVRRLARAGEEGLDPKSYAVAAIGRRLAGRDNGAATDLDLLLTDALVRYARDLRHGRVSPARTGSLASPEPKTFSPDALIADALAATDMASFLDGLTPRDPRYTRLKTALARYRAIASRGGWPEIPNGRTLKPGAYDERVAALRRRLRLTGDLAGPRESAKGDQHGTLYDAALAAAVRRFQHRHGLAGDAVVGRRTRAALNASAEDRARQIALNLERRRHLAGALGSRYVFVNIADATVKYVEQRSGIERTLLSMRAVVGLPYRETPVFSTVMTQLQYNPSWYVPATIANQDIVPRLRRDPGYLARQGFDILTGAGPGGRIVDPGSLAPEVFRTKPFPYLLRQRPGPENALGRIKFVMPNRFNVYLHDTPARALLERPARAFSSGCIRLEKPLELAALLLKSSRAAVEAAIAPGRMTFVRLDAPVPVHVAYLTAWANKDGAVHFRHDIYGRDARLANSLTRR